MSFNFTSNQDFNLENNIITLDEKTTQAVSKDIAALSKVLDLDKSSASRIYINKDFIMPNINHDNLSTQDKLAIQSSFDDFIQKNINEFNPTRYFASFDFIDDILSYEDRRRIKDTFVKKIADLVVEKQNTVPIVDSDEQILRSIICHGLLLNGVNPDEVIHKTKFIVQQLKEK